MKYLFKLINAIKYIKYNKKKLTNNTYLFIFSFKELNVFY